MPDFVTGATGCVGRYLVRRLLARGRDLICAVRCPESLAGDPLFSSSGVRLVCCDFTAGGWDKGVSTDLAVCQNVFHVAGEMPHRPSSNYGANSLWKVNVEAVQQLYALAATASVKRFLFVSSLSVYGDSLKKPCDEYTPVMPEDAYACTKAEAEQVLTVGVANGGPAVITIRPGLIYGDRDTGVIQKIIALIDKGYFRILGDGGNSRSISAAPLVAEALCALVESRERLTVVDVVDPHSPTLENLAADIASLLGVAPPRHIPLTLVYPVATVFSLLALLGMRTSFKVSDVRKISTSNPVRGERLSRLVGRLPDYYREALAEDVAWYRRRQAVA